MRRLALVPLLAAILLLLGAAPASGDGQPPSNACNGLGVADFELFINGHASHVAQLVVGHLFNVAGCTK